MEGFLVSRRDEGGLASVFVAKGRSCAGPAGGTVRAGSSGVSLNGADIRAGGASRVEGTVVSCLDACLTTGGIHEVTLGKMVGASLSSIEVMHRVAAAGLSREPVLILGESGTGKELVAESLGSRAGSMYALNMGAVPPELAEAELFGFSRGAFTGAVDNREGALEAARDGVLFLDELAEAPGWVQAKLLRAMDSGRFRRLGSNREIHLRARMVAATNVDPVDGVADGRLRLDLLERLGCHVVRLAPLRTRPADIPCLVALFASRYEDVPDSGFAPPSADVIDLMRRWPWHGNVRELKNVVSRVLLYSRGGLADVGLVRESLEAGRFLADRTGIETAPVATRQQEILQSSLPRSTYYYRLKRGRIASDTGPRRIPTSAALKT